MRNNERNQPPKRTDRETRPTLTHGVPGPLLRLNRLLDAGLIDVNRIGREIRAEPELEFLTAHMAASLALSPANSVEGIEEAVALLGPDRLRVVFYEWSLLRQKGAQISSEHASEGWSVEALYLASFLRYLGLDSPDAAILHREMFAFTLDPRRHEFSDLRDMLMRDFLALVPTLDPSLLRPIPRKPVRP